MSPSRVFAFFGALSLGIFPVLASDYDYCSKQCDGASGPHTMCEKYFPAGGGDKCKDYQMGLTASEKQQLLDLHNALRQKIANGGEKNKKNSKFPTASNMMVLAWHKETAMIAQRLADQCTSNNHDQCRDPIKADSGQNLAGGTYFTSKGVNLTQSVHNWYGEIKDYSAPENPNTFTWTSGVGHFTQSIWASSYALGCGIRRTLDNPIGKFWLVCNYTPAGNVLGESMYKPGKPCSACPSGSHCSKKWTGLCTYNKNDKAE